MKEELIVKIADDVNAQARRNLLKTANDQEIARAIKDIKTQQFFNKGWSKERNMRWIGRIPLDIYQACCKIYGERNLKKDKRLFKRVFEPWLIVKKESI